MGFYPIAMQSFTSSLERQVVHQLLERRIEHLSELHKVKQANIALTALYEANEVAMHVDPLGERFLREPTGLPQRTNTLPKHDKIVVRHCTQNVAVNRNSILHTERSN